MSEQGTASHLAYDWMIVTYFFFGGLSAGAYMFSVVANYWKQEFKSLAKRSAVLSLVALAIGLFILLDDLGQPSRAWRLFAAFNPRSMLSWGVWFLNIFGLMNLIYTVLLFKDKEVVAKKFACLGLPFAVLTATYTAMLLAQAPGRTLWHSALMPVLFLNGAIISGFAVVMLFSVNKENTELLSKLGRFVAWLIILEVGMVISEIIILLNGGTESVAVAEFLLSGRFGWLFLGLEIALGAVVPVIILLRARINALSQIVASLLILIGIFAMRYVIVVGGQLTS
ncbi:MAG: NrfD/PsrC family molybdoenzyme membrane anchor subunit [Planctomycetota bacterium]|jgi:molybdopterin-containing oxidoreductase family membrane subunit